jgi:hypothetical protein
MPITTATLHIKLIHLINKYVPSVSYVPGSKLDIKAPRVSAIWHSLFSRVYNEIGNRDINLVPTEM